MVGCPAAADEGALVLWASIRTKIETAESNRMKKERLDQGSPVWLDWRDKGIGGSEVASIVGAEYRRKENKADWLWRKKLPKDHPQSVGEQADNSRLAHGRKYEPECRAAYEALFGWSVVPECVIHDDHSFIRCSLDGCRSDDKLICEIKCSGERNHHKYIDLAKISDPLERQTALALDFNYYRYQMLWQLLITGAECCHFVGYSPSWPEVEDRLTVVPVYPEPVEMDRLMQRAIEFWQFVESRSAPTAEWMRPCHEMPVELRIPNNPTTTIA
jgi:putative phage-type endonuclease